MIYSMTGYGKSIVEFNGKKIHAEIKSLNSKSLDLSTRIHALYREKELDIRTLIQQRLLRGKVDFMLWVEKDNAQGSVSLNPQLIGIYYQQLKDIVRTTGIPEPADWMSVLLQLPDVATHPDVEELKDEEWQAVMKGVEQAIEQLISFRRQEGDALAVKFREKTDNIRMLLESIEPYERERVEKIRQRIVGNLEQLDSVGYDGNRLEQEMIYYIEKLDISEEKQRLTNHLNYFIETLNGPEGQGKKLGFIAQEMGREINTTGSKSNHAEMQNIVVKMKDELEQIKEQVLNVL